MLANLQGPPRWRWNRPTVRRALPSLSASNTAFVISSTKSGIPSVRSTISAVTSAGSPLLPTRCAIDGRRFTLSKSVERQAHHL